MPKTNLERQEALRQKRHKEGLIRVEFWIKPAWRNAIVKLVNELRD